jgi:hypothetical protein
MSITPGIGAGGDDGEPRQAYRPALTNCITGAPTAATPGYTDRVRHIVVRVAAAVTACSPLEFGFDVLDTIAYGFGAFGFDVLDVINEGRQHDIATRCTGCGQAWLWTPEA